MDDRFTTSRVLKAWWAMQWRAVLATFVGSLVLIALFSFFAALMGVSKGVIMMLGNIIYTGVAIFASFYFFGYSLRKDYGDFRFEISQKPPEATEPPTDRETDAESPESSSAGRN